MNGPVYSMRSIWDNEPAEPLVVGERFLVALDRLTPLGPEMNNWWLVDRPNLVSIPLEDARSRIAEITRNNVALDAFDEPWPDDGYWLYAQGAEIPSEFGSSKSVGLTATTGGRWTNELEFEIGDVGRPPNLALVTYPTYRGALEILASQWPCPWLFVDGIVHIDPKTGAPMFPDGRPPFQNVWIAYLSPALAAGVTPSSELTFERTPGGGLIMSAVEERFDVTNADHMRRSRILQFIMAEQTGCPVDPQESPPCLPARIGPY